MARALLVIDLLNDFTRPEGALYVPEARRVLPAARREIDRAHAAGEPVVYVCDVHAPDDPEFSRWPPHAVRGTWGAAVDPELPPPEPRDHIVRKTTYSSFHKTSLRRTLNALGVDAVRLVGCVTHICILYAAMEAALRGYSVEVAEDAVAGIDPGDHAFALRQMQAVHGARLV